MLNAECPDLEAFVLEERGESLDLQRLPPVVIKVYERICSARHLNAQLMTELGSYRQSDAELNLKLVDYSNKVEQLEQESKKLMDLSSRQLNDLNTVQLQLEDAEKMARVTAWTRYVLPVLVGGMVAMNHSSDSGTDRLTMGLGAGVATMLLDDLTGQHVARSIGWVVLRF